MLLLAQSLLTSAHPPPVDRRLNISVYKTDNCQGMPNVFNDIQYDRAKEHYYFENAPIKSYKLSRELYFWEQLKFITTNKPDQVAPYRMVAGCHNLKNKANAMKFIDIGQ
ncbi:MAG: hypothetical protein L6R40_008656 [Gallowayella cf. fulva]|nr:MAG: hypothetical protein L6R40_008656 [Xanthomendoza cf. fulva]